MKAYKFLAEDGRGVFSRFVWPQPDDGPGAWVESAVVPCRSGVHACRPADLPYWVAPELYEIELDGPVELELKVVAPRGRLTRRIDGWNEDTRQEYSQMCVARARELAEAAPEPMEAWAPGPGAASEGPALASFMAARIAERLGGVGAYVDERMRQSSWLVERLGLAS
jgi:hypothetical protein